MLIEKHQLFGLVKRANVVLLRSDVVNTLPVTDKSRLCSTQCDVMFLIKHVSGELYEYVITKVRVNVAFRVEQFFVDESVCWVGLGGNFHLGWNQKGDVGTSQHYLWIRAWSALI